MSMNGLSATQPAFLLNGEIRRGIMGLLWLLRMEILRLTLSCTSSFYYWLPRRCRNEVFLCRVYHHSWSLCFFSELNLVALQKNIKHASYSMSCCCFFLSFQRQCQRCVNIYLPCVYFSVLKRHTENIHGHTCTQWNWSFHIMLFGVICVAWCIGLNVA